MYEKSQFNNTQNQNMGTNTITNKKLIQSASSTKTFTQKLIAFSIKIFNQQCNQCYSQFNVLLQFDEKSQKKKKKSQQLKQGRNHTNKMVVNAINKFYLELSIKINCILNKNVQSTIEPMLCSIQRFLANFIK